MDSLQSLHPLARCWHSRSERRLDGLQVRLELPERRRCLGLACWLDRLVRVSPIPCEGIHAGLVEAPLDVDPALLPQLLDAAPDLPRVGAQCPRDRLLAHEALPA